jgi:hypothetical protein
LGALALIWNRRALDDPVNAAIEELVARTEVAPRRVEARSLQLAVWTAFVAERRPELRERARERLDALLAG